MGFSASTELLVLDASTTLIITILLYKPHLHLTIGFEFDPNHQTPDSPKFCIVNVSDSYKAGERRVSRGTGYDSIPREWPQHPKNIFRFPMYTRLEWQTATKFCMVIKQDKRKFFAGSTIPVVYLAKKICDTNADSQFVCSS